MRLKGLYGGIEAGGTKFVCVVGRGPSDIVAESRFATTGPDETLAQVIEFFQPYCKDPGLRAIGLASFGPCALGPTSPDYGRITSTPKPGWQDTDVVGPLQAALNLELAFDTDVNASALGEQTWGAGLGKSTCLYLTIGTGIGGGFVVDGLPLHGLQHPEMGHIRIRHDRVRDPFAGSCPFHGDCLEGLASGPAIRARLGRRGEELAVDDPFWALEAEYLGDAVACYTLVLSPHIVVLGGGIMQRTQLLPLVRDHVRRLLGGYIRQPETTSAIDKYIVNPALGSRSGVLGALCLAALKAGESLQAART